MGRNGLIIATIVALALVGGLVWFIDQPARASFDADAVRTIASLSLSKLPALAPDPSNRVSDDPAAAALGEALFSDERLSASGTMACASCHIPDNGFDDGKLPGQSVGVTTRRAMPLAGTAYSPWFFWDGRADSQWAQALGPMENVNEQSITRVAVAQLIARDYRAQYEALFGPLPALEGLPAGAGPLGTEAEKAAWGTLDAATQDAVNTIFANAGKSIAAFERTIEPEQSRFDDFADAIAAGQSSDALTAEEQRGLAVFVGRGNCTQCHNGPLLTDNFFHNTGVPLADGLPLDLGRLPALKQVDDDPFNCLGAYSDAEAGQCGELRFKATGDTLLRAFKTPSLRGVSRRAPFMHAGQFADLETVVEHYNAAAWAPIGVSEVHRLDLTEQEMADLVAFLKAL